MSHLNNPAAYVSVFALLFHVPKNVKFAAVTLFTGSMNPGKARMANIFSLAKGTVLAQFVFVLATPILTRVYTPEQLGTFGLYSALVLILSRFAGFRYELAIPLPRQDRIAANLVLLTTLLTVLSVIIAYALYILAAANYDLSTEKHLLNDYALFIILGVAAFVINETLIFWSIRQKQFEVIASARVINAFSLAILQLSGYLFDATLHFLIASYPLSLLISIVYQLKKMDLELFAYHGSRWRLFRILSIRYRDFPMYTTPSSGLFELSQALPLFVLKPRP